MENTDDQDPPEDERTNDLDQALAAIYRETFVFKHKVKMGYDVLEAQMVSVDVTEVENPEEMVDRALRGFFSFLDNLGYEPKLIFDRAMEILTTARIRLENPETFGKKIKVSPDAGLEAFLVRVRNFDESLLRDLYSIYLGKIHLN